MLKKRGFWIGFIVSLLFLFLALRGQDYGRIGRELKSAHYLWLAPALAVYFVAVFLRAVRWQVLLRPVKVISPARLFPVIVIGYMGNNALYLRAGEVIRAFVLRRREKTSASAVLATIVVERTLDGLTMLLFFFLVLPFIPLDQTLRRMLLLASIIFFGALLVFFLLAARPARLVRAYYLAVESLVPGRFRSGMVGALERFLEGLQVLRSGREMLIVFGLSVALWLFETSKYFFVMQGFAFRQPFYVLMLTTAVVNLAVGLPATPGYWGVFELATVFTLKLFGVEPEVALSFAIVLHAALYFPITALGFFYMWREGLSWYELTERRERAEPA